MKIITIYKQKGCKKMLQYYRGIFLAIPIFKLFESLIKGRIQMNFNKIHPLQAGNTGRCAADNVFFLRAAVDIIMLHAIKHYSSLLMTTNKPLIAYGLKNVS